MRGITEEPGSCCDCAKDLPIPRRSNKKRCDACSHSRDLKRMAYWYKTHAQAAEKIRCEFRGGADLPEKYREKYRPTSSCLGEFDRKNPREKYCDTCKPVARRWQQLDAALKKYHTDEKKAAKRALKNRLKRRKAEGRPVRVLGRLYPCAYRKNGNRGEGCVGQFKPTSSAQKFCKVCRKHAAAETARRSRLKHQEKIKQKDHERWETLMKDASRGKSFRPDARGLTSLTKSRITLAACLAADGLSEYAMADQLNPGSSETLEARRQSLRSFWRTQRRRLELETAGVAARPKAERDAIAEKARQSIRDEMHSRHARKRRLIH